MHVVDTLIFEARSVLKVARDSFLRIARFSRVL